MPQSSGGSAVYVSPSGSDGNAGTLSAPVQSLNTALSIAVSGTNIYLRGGNYGRQYIFHHIYSASNPVTVQSYPGERAVMVGDATYLENAVHFDDVTGVRIRNITFDATQNTTALKFTNPSHVEVENVLIENTDRGCNDLGVIVPSGEVPACGWGIGLTVIGAPLSNRTNQLATDVQVWDSTFTNNGAYSKGPGGAIKHAHAMYLCTGPVANGCDGFVVANNVIYDNPTGNAVQIGDSAHNGIVTNNTLDTTDTRAISQTSLCTQFSGSGIDLWGSTSNVLIVNNILANNCGPAVLWSGETGGGNFVRNNLGYHNCYALDWDGCAPGEYNGAYGGIFVAAIGPNLPDADPKYVNTTGAWGSLSKDFHLQTGSPALGKSEPAFTPPFDKNGVARPAAPAVGAYD